MPRKRIRITEQPEIKKLKRGGYSIRFRIPEHDGKPAEKSKWKKCPAKKKGELGAYIEEYRTQLEDEINDYMSRDDITLGEYARKWHDDRENSPKIKHTSWRREENQITEIENDQIAKIPIQDLTMEDIEEFKVRMQKAKWTADKQRRVLGKVKQITKYAKKHKKIKSDVGADVDNVQVTKKKRRALPEEKILEIIKALETEEQTGRTAVIKLAMSCGFRRGECLGLHWGDIDLGKRTIDVERQLNAEKEEVDPKHGSRGIVPIDMDTADWLRRWKKRTSELYYEGEDVPDSASVCCSDTGGKLYPANFDRWRRMWFVRHGLGVFNTVEKWVGKDGRERTRYSDYDGYKLHELRHTAATDLVASGADLRSVQAIMRHKKLSTTEGYLHERESRMKEAVDVLGDARRAKIVDEVEKPKRTIGSVVPHDPKNKKKRQRPLKRIIEDAEK